MAMAFHNNNLNLLLLGVFPLLVCLSVTTTIAGPPILDVSSLNRSSFPAGFVFGTATSSYQVEGAWNEDGKGASTWDNLTHSHPEQIEDRSTGDIAIDHYHRYKEDIKIMKDMNTDAYRFSISWARILPRMQPFVTLFHWDLPQALQDEYKGFNSPNISKDFEEYADICFKNFGERVKHWITLNEPWTYSMRMEQPYMSSHYQLLAHAAAVKLYKTKYQASQKGLIGITLNSNWFIPFSNKTIDEEAAQRALDFQFGW
ncbi:hypothetical protein Ahy_A03g016668 [Arachis hypogaea]|uniref:Beta-glucosidase n=1 Tax=Arachis hypogaea TaxID=3818 RepID=A0A445E411_ARAHY|nr:hypothetical protein Ahy_A03g016668 [Arachis hypogaea]